MALLLSAHALHQAGLKQCCEEPPEPGSAQETTAQKGTARKRSKRESAVDPADSQLHSVEKVVDSRKLVKSGPGRKPVQYLVKWQGRSWGACSWVDKHSSMGRLVQEFSANGADPEDRERMDRDDPA